MNQSDPREFRNALGQFATGVTVITTRDSNDRPVGVTASSFNSVSLDPPLVLWSLDKASVSLNAFSQHGYFAVHILATGQEDLSNNFARRGEDKFGGIEIDKGIGNVPLLPECAACFQCKLNYEYDGGDHIILVGEVLNFVNHDSRPLIFHGGSYARAQPSVKDAPTLERVLNVSNGAFSSDFLGYLISRAHYQLHLPLLSEIAALDMKESHYFLLSVLSIKNSIPLDQINRFLAHTCIQVEMSDCRELEIKKLIAFDKQSGNLQITEEGKSTYVAFLAADVAREKRALADFTAEELADFVGYLKRIIDKTDPGVPDLWDAKN